MLRAVARGCAEALGPADLLGRMGGEEFARLPPDADEAAALRAAERLRAALAERPVEVGPKALRVTASLGASTLAPAIADAEGWLAATDAGLHAAKAGGRNRCCLAGRHRA